MKYYLLFMILANLITACGQKTELISQWRGPNRDGIYRDSVLLKSWPETGPEMVWSFEGLGAGHGSVGFSPDKVFVLGMPDTTGVLYAFDYFGNLLWSKEYGTEWYKNYTGPRSTPTVVGNLVYFVSGQGVAYCYDERTGELVWSVDLLKTFDAENIQWGIAESVLIDGDHVICTPGGKVHNVVALNRFTGKTVWTSPAMGEQSAYCSPTLINHNGTRLFITKTAESVFALNPDNGHMYWSVPQKQRHKIHSNTPVYWEGRVFCSSENAPEDNGLVSLLLSEDGKTATIEWRNEQYTNLMGGIILKDGYIYGSEYRERGWSVTHAFTGEVVHTSDTLGTGVVIWADDRFYCYTEDGKMSLVDAGPQHFNIISSFYVPLGTDQHWAHPVIHGKRLYIRHGNALMVYDIEDKKPK